jgi:hypothetical protein
MKKRLVIIPLTVLAFVIIGVLILTQGHVTAQLGYTRY